MSKVDPEFRAKALAYAASLSDEDDARLTAAALSDPDNPLETEEVAARRRPADPETVARHRALAKGIQPAAKPAAEQVPVQLSREVVEHFRAAGPGWQVRIDDALRRLIAESR